MQETLLNSWVRTIPLRRDKLPTYSWASLVAQMVKNLPVMWETWVWSWVGKIPLRREQLPTPVFLPGESPWTEEPGGLQSMGSQGVDWAMKHTAYHWILRQRELKMSHDSAFIDRVEGGLIETRNKLGQEGDLRQNTTYQINYSWSVCGTFIWLQIASNWICRSEVLNRCLGFRHIFGD